jgi:molybdopterin molybdotransferase
MVEHAAQDAAQPGLTADLVRLAEPRELVPGENIVPRGAEAHAGDLLVSPGQRIGPAHIAIAAQCGYSQLSVARQPIVAILSTGDELVPVEGTPGPVQIRNSNAPMLAALVTAAGGVPLILPAVPDEDAALDATLDKVLTGTIPADLLLITGGISAGKFDLVEGALSRAGATFLIGGVAMQPGKPVVFGQLPRGVQAGLPVFALPGNPISSAVTFHLFAAPVMAALGGDSGPQPRFALARLTEGWSGKPGLTRVLPAWCDFSSGASASTAEVRLVPWQGSGDIAAFARSNCFVRIADDTTELPPGSIVQILLI